MKTNTLKTKTLIMGAALGAGVLELAACGGSGVAMQGSPTSAASTTTTAPVTSQTEMLDTQQVLAVAQAPSETTDPKSVGAGAWMVADAEDETSDPLPVG